MNQPKCQEQNVRLSKSLSWLLRHGAPKSGLKIYPGGYLKLLDILNDKKFKPFTVDDIKNVVAKNDKQRFSLKEHEEDGLLIRANQGHSFHVDESELLDFISSPSDCPIAIHGTYLSNLDNIERRGLSRMQRNHIHLAAGEPGTEGVISGMRHSAQVYIYIDVAKAMQDGIKFYRSQNNVILTPGNDSGVLEPKYFLQVRRLKS